MKTVPMSQTYNLGSETFSKLEFREPNYGDYRQIGPAYDVEKGVVFVDREAVNAYGERLLIGLNGAVLNHIALIDGLRVEAAVLGFFSEANARAFVPASSSSGSDGAPQTSSP